MKSFAVLDVEYIQVTRKHQCVRKLFMLTHNSALKKEFYPCKRYRDIEIKYQAAFRYCRNHIHKLTYNPRFYTTWCETVIKVLKDFIEKNKIQFVLYKGGDIERNLCEEIGIPSYNIEALPGIEKAPNHDPEAEVRFHFKQILEYGAWS